MTIGGRQCILLLFSSHALQFEISYPKNKIFYQNEYLLVDVPILNYFMPLATPLPIFFQPLAIV